ncbi:MAG TPA: hypothetical protein VFV68_04045 [Agriterribacter sp.]|nr:hypothetical protein [Agriterribacter sp.]
MTCFILLLQHAQAQNNAVADLQQQFKQYNEHSFTEKVYLHVDRNFYVAGEIIWFKAYVTDGVMGYTSNLSKIAYVDVIGKNNNPYLQAKIALNNGLGNGSFYLPANIPSGTYKIRAYTNWMKNADPDYYFEKSLTIINTLADTGLPPVDSATGFHIQFFPEGGNLVAGIESKVAFRMTDKNGKGVNDFSGVLVDNNTDTILHFKPLHAGIGTFIFTPLSGHTYTPYINSASVEALTGNMPEALSNGYVMQLNTPSPGKISIAIQSSQSASAAGAEVYLITQTKGVIKSAQAKPLQSGSVQFDIDEDVLGEGISQFTVFSSQQQPVCERLYFKRPTDQLHIEAKTNEANYTTRKKVRLHVSSHNRNSLPADLSVTVFRLDGLQAEEQNNIYSYLWLSSDLKGTVEFPSYYFQNNNDSTNTALDNLMLTHGWRRFKWTDVQQNKKPVLSFLPEYEGHIIEGKITDTITRKPYAEATAYFSLPTVNTKFYTSTSDANGNLRFYTRGIYGPGELVAQAEGLKAAGCNIEINTPFSDQYSSRKLSPPTISPKQKNALEINSINAQVQKKYAADQLKKFLLPTIDTTSFYGKADESYLLDNYTRFTTMEEVLREYVLGVIVGRSEKKFHLTVVDLPNRGLFKDNPLVLLDGVPVQDVDRFMSYDPLKIRKLEVVKRKYYYGPLLLHGILNFTTYKGNMEGYQFDRESIVVDFEGMQLQREFYMPVYETTEQMSSRKADFRNLLFWSPDVITNENGDADLEFYTSDVKGKYIGVIEGITRDGKAGTNTFGFEVKAQD